MPLETVTPTPTLLVTPSPTPLPDEVRGLVADVISGDTVSVVLEGDPPNRTYQVRYIGIEAPPNEPGEPWGVAAYEANRKMTNMKVVRLVADESKVDDEGNLLRYVYAGDELLSIIMVEQGLARADINPPNTRFGEEIREAEARAREGRLGLWGQPPTPSTATEEEEETDTPEPTDTDLATSEGTPAASPEATGTEEATAEPTP
jgi:micrococcal nuclease